MKFKKILREPLFYSLLLLAVAFLIIIFMQPKISDIKLTRNNITEDINFPYLANDIHSGEVFFISFNLSVKNESAKFNIIPDDCIQKISINGKNFPLKDIKGLCDTQIGAYFDFSTYTQRGMNHFEFRIINSGGGPAGFNIKTPSGFNQFSIMYCIFAFLFLFSFVLILRKFKFIFITLKNKCILPSQLSERQHICVFIFILIFACFLRIWGFGEYPAGFNQDELILAYDAYSDAVYGMDQNGDHNPVYNVSWGSGQSMGYNYILRPFIMAFGFNIATVRLPMLIFSIISLFFFYLLLKHIFGANVALMGMFILASNPWHIMISRWALDCNLAPLIFLPAVYFSVISPKKPVFFILSMFLFGCASYGYITVLMLFIIFIPLMIWYVFRNKIVPVKYAVSGFLTLALVSAPLAICMFINTFDFPAFKLLWLSIPRMTVMRSASTVSFDVNNFKNLGELLLTGSDGLISNAIHPFGAIYPFMLAFVLFGIYVLFAKYKGKAAEMKFWFISAVILSLAINININRINMIFFPLIFLATLGIAEISRHAKFAALILASLIIITTLCFANVYFTTFNQNNQYMYFNLYDKAIEYAVQNTSLNSTIHISGVNAPYVFALYVTKLPPERFVNTVVYANPNAEFRHVVRFDRFVTNVPHFLNPGETGVFHKNEVSHNLREQAKKITPFGNFLVVEN